MCVLGKGVLQCSTDRMGMKGTAGFMHVFECRETQEGRASGVYVCMSIATTGKESTGVCMGEHANVSKKRLGEEHIEHVQVQRGLEKVGTG